ncbi:hypothetical protein CTAYLR_003206 [Chrysophaeum taylorii]|uniref:Uncharacterized protein n=1 Tax=Chrysophaeum taylorii TaxID=2483200 RepID=A0AAD7UB91_9STRA|nr:hypothetical protein CTAYLR_003206 [Chrysophaeum taylorii]
MNKTGAMLGAAGLVPFVATSRPCREYVDPVLKPLRKWRPSLNATELQVTYGCCILSFLGGPHWFTKPLWAVTPPLIAWPAASMPAPASLDLLSIGFVAAFVADATFAALRLVPRTYLLLRAPLTLVAVGALQSNHPARKFS